MNEKMENHPQTKYSYFIKVCLLLSCILVFIVIYLVIYTGSSIINNNYKSEIDEAAVNKCCRTGSELSEDLVGCRATSISSKLSAKTTQSLNLPCDHLERSRIVLLEEDIDLTTGTIYRGNKSLSPGDYCIDTLQFKGEGKVVALICSCLKIPCIRVCCPRGQLVSFTDKLHNLTCEDASSDWSNWSLASLSEGQGLVPVFGAPAECRVQLRSTRGNNFSILADGNLQVHSSNGKTIRAPTQYCVGVVRDLDITSVQAIFCPTNVFFNPVMYTMIYVSGATFLLLTLVVHALVPELMAGVRGLSLVAHCTFFFIAYVALTIKHLNHDIVGTACCTVLGYFIHFTLTAGYFWLNVMCIDICSTFKSLQRNLHDSKSEMRQFLVYCVYSLGSTLAISLLTLSADFIKGLPDWMPDPNVGTTDCWFREDNDIAMIAFFYAPVGILMLINSSMFVFALVKIISFYRETAFLDQSETRTHRQSQFDRNRIVLFAKLFGLMGIPWAMEVIAWLVGGDFYNWYLTDTAIVLRSLFIFVVFCCKPKVWTLLKEKFPWLRSKVNLEVEPEQSGGMSTNRTNVQHSK